MTELVIIIGQTRDGVIDALKMKSTLEQVGIEIKGILTKESKGEKVPKEMIESIFKIKVTDNPNLDSILRPEGKSEVIL